MGFPNRGPAVLGVTATILGLATIFVFLRMVSRIGIVRRMQHDDWWILAAWILSFGFSFTICYGTADGLGRHEIDVSGEDFVPLQKLEYAFSVLYNPSLMATKTSILVFYLNLSASHKLFRWATIATLAVVNIAGLALTLLNIFQCHPVAATFLSGQHCLDILAIYLSSAPVNIATDLAILVLPMPILTRMRLPKKQKYILVLTFSAGIFVVVVDILRIASLQSAADSRLNAIKNATGSSRQAEEKDFSWYAALAFMWSAVEVNVGIMCACVPALKPLVARFMPHLLRGSDDHSTVDYQDKDENMTANSTDMHAAHAVPTLPDSPLTPMAMPRSPNSHAGPPHFGPSREDNEDGGDMGLMDFLTSPDMDEMPKDLQRSYTAMTNTSRATRRNSVPAMFDLEHKPCLVNMSTKDSIMPFALVTILFFIWGFAYGLLSSLNAAFQAIADMTPWESQGIHIAYYGGYFLAPLTFGRYTLTHYGFKPCYIVGLSIYALGTLIFWPSAVLTSFPAFLISNFIVGLGLSTLEIAANPFIFLCGPPQWGEVRLNLSQAIQATATVFSPLILKTETDRGSSKNPGLLDVQWTYLGIALFMVILALVYVYIPLPEASDEELEDAVRQERRHVRLPFMSNREVNIIWVTLAIGIWTQWNYLGAQESLGTSFITYLNAVAPQLDGVNYQAIGHTAFAVSRFLAAFMGLFMKPRHMLLIFGLGSVIFSILAMHFNDGTSVAMAEMVFFFEGPLFNLIFAQTLRGMGKHTKNASALITSSISGGAIWPIFQQVVIDQRGLQYSFSIIAAGFGLTLIMPLYLEFVPAAKEQCDPIARDGRRDCTTTRRHNLTTTVSNTMHHRHRHAHGTEKRRESTDDDTQPTRRDFAQTNGRDIEKGSHFNGMQSDFVEKKEDARGDQSSSSPDTIATASSSGRAPVTLSQPPPARTAARAPPAPSNTKSDPDDFDFITMPEGI